MRVHAIVSNAQKYGWNCSVDTEGVARCVKVSNRRFEEKKDRARKEGIKTSLRRFNAQRIMCTYTSGPEVSRNIINPLTSDEATVRRMIVKHTGRSGKSSGTGFVYTLFLVAFYYIIILSCSALRNSSVFLSLIVVCSPSTCRALVLSHQKRHLRLAF